MRDLVTFFLKKKRKLQSFTLKLYGILYNDCITNEMFVEKGRPNVLLDVAKQAKRTEKSCKKSLWIVPQMRLKKNKT